MANVTEDFYGLTEAEYNELMATYSDSFSEWAKYFEKVTAANGTFYSFSGNEMDLLELGEDLGVDINLTYFTYILSTNSVSGF